MKDLAALSKQEIKFGDSVCLPMALHAFVLVVQVDTPLKGTQSGS